ncbi:hypothetical protein [Robertkochia flava]|uniref:hypothetical protein n=1 Tax=Robertkochia flava TaxID=3447986 RepID=UPI001CCCCE7E|nr:hypothetical protein [Robertkochia marina]
MTLKQTFKEYLELELPIGGGDGSSAEEAIVINDPSCDIHELQSEVMENYYAIKEYPWKLLMRRLDRIEGKPVDVVKAGYIKNGNTYVQDWYFDLTGLKLF